MAEALYDIPLDGLTSEKTFPFPVKTLTFVNGSDQSINVTDDQGRRITIGAGDGGPVPVLNGRHFTFTAAAATANGSAWVIASDKRLPGSVGALTTAGGGGGGGAVTIASGADVAEGATGAAAYADGTGAAAGTVIGLLKGVFVKLSNALTVAINNFPATQTVDQTAHALGAQGNLWNAATPGAGGNSAAVQLTNQHYAAVYGHVSAATVLSLQFSIDNVNFYTVNAITTTGASDFGFTNVIVPIGSYVRLSTSAAVTATATVEASA